MKNVMIWCMVLLMGLHQVADAREKGSADEAVALVKKAGSFLKENGKEKLLTEINNMAPAFVSKDLYLFAYGTNGDGVNLAHGANKKMIGKNMLELRDADGVYIVKKFLEAANSKAGNGWVDYKWTNPKTGALEAKSTYVERFGDIIIGCGIYK